MSSLLKALLLLCAVILILGGVSHAKRPAKLYGVTILDVNNVETHMSTVKVYQLEEVFGEERPRKKGIDVIKGNRGEGSLEVKVRDISEFIVEPVKAPDAATGLEGALKLAVRLWNGEHTALYVTPQDSNVLFEGKSEMGAFSINLRSIRKIIVRRKAAK
jgi:hypothetical protein